MTALSDLKPGQAATITAVSGDRPDEARRLLDLGFVPGTSVGVERRAPLGGPTVYLLRGSRIALRRSSATLVMVEQVEVSGPTGATR